MAYDTQFFDRYAAYLNEPGVRRVHARAFSWFRDSVPVASAPVVDLGCGLGEYCRYGYYARYLGIDSLVQPTHPGTVLQDDYLSLGLPDRLRASFGPRAFVSLFSLEPVLPRVARYAAYASFFHRLPMLEFGLSAGFYYADERAEKDVVDEADGTIVSYQANDRLGDIVLPGIEERRFVVRNPSAMFGDSVVEVWKLFLRC